MVTAMEEFDRNPFVNAIVDLALEEDLSLGDITTDYFIDGNRNKTGVVIVKEKGIVAGLELAIIICRKVDNNLKVKLLAHDGDFVKPYQHILKISGPQKSILMIERTLLNFLTHLSGIATLTNQFVEALKNKNIEITETRKTLPGLRVLEKYAVLIGGGKNHRFNLYESFLIKDNHLKIIYSRPHGDKILLENFQKAKSKHPDKIIEIEAKNFAEVKKFTKIGFDYILLDNMPLPVLKNAVEYIRNFEKKAGRKIFIEVSGGVNLEKVGYLSKLDINRISIGALTHSAKALNMSLEIV